MLSMIAGLGPGEVLLLLVVLVVVLAIPVALVVGIAVLVFRAMEKRRPERGPSPPSGE
jgi:hypothetical protein